MVSSSNRRKQKRNWSKKEGAVESVMFVQATENSELKNRIQISAKKNGLKIKVQERTGTKLKQILQRSDPFSKKRCNRETCEICKRELGNMCRVQGCVYELECKGCSGKEGVRNKYRGQTGRSMYARINQHFYDRAKNRFHLCGGIRRSRIE